MDRKTVAAGIAGFALASGLFIITGHAEQPADSESRWVTVFNDGFSEGMADACEQGSNYACEWIAKGEK